MSFIKNVPMQDLIAAPENPFKVTMDSEMERLIESIAESGIIAPPVVRPMENGKYEIVSGHRRKADCEYLGMKVVPCVVKELDKNEALIFLVDSNLQRENILPSEKAFAYKLKMDALNRQGKRTDLTFSQVGKKLNSYEEAAKESGDSRNQIHRYIRLTHLIPELLQMVDEKRIALTPAVELSYLQPEEQKMLLSEIEYGDCTPSLSQAQRLKELSNNGAFTADTLSEIMGEEKANQKERIKIPVERLRKFFPRNYTTTQMEDEIVKLCEAQYRRRMRNRDAR